jgi:hypothetical protein
MMLNRAITKRDDLSSFILKLQVETDASRKIPAADVLTSDDWRVLEEVREILQPLYLQTMRTQGWGNGAGHGRLWEVMTGMEYVLEHLEEWKFLYDDPPTDPAADKGIPGQERSPRADKTLEDSPVRTPMPRRLRDRPQQLSRRFGPRFNEAALPLHARVEYTSAFESLGTEERAHVKASINNAWAKLEEYYGRLGESPLFAAAVILNPNMHLRWLERNWNFEAGDRWLREAKTGLKAYLDRWYPLLDTSEDQKRPELPYPAPRDEDDDFEAWVRRRQAPAALLESELERYYKISPQQGVDPIQWWFDHEATFPSLSQLALDLAAIPAMGTDPERSFSSAKLTYGSQRHSLDPDTIESLQLMKDWLRKGQVTLGGVNAQIYGH